MITTAFRIKKSLIEFEFNGNWFVYDDHYKYPVLLKDYYKAVSPYKIYKKFTQEELVVYLKKDYTRIFLQRVRMIFYVIGYGFIYKNNPDIVWVEMFFDY